MEKCINCDHPINESDNFCPSCGQKTFERLALKTLLGELASAYFAWDSKLFKTLKLLLFKPGEVSKQYISGKRKNYVAPLRVYFFFSVLFFLGVAYLGNSQGGIDFEDENTHITVGEERIELSTDTLLIMDQHDRLDELPAVSQLESEFWRHMAKQVIRLQIKGSSFQKVFQNNLSVMLFLFIPVFALVLNAFYRKKKFLYIEHLVYGLYFHSFLFFVLFITLVLSQLLGNAWPLPLGILGTVIYFTFGLKRFYNYKWGWTVIKAFLIGGVYTLLAIIFTLGNSCSDHLFVLIKRASYSL